MQNNIIAVVPAAGVGKRMKADRPKQYLSLANKTVLEQTIDKLLSVERVQHVIVVISEDDPYIKTLKLGWINKPITLVKGGAERVDSVLAGLIACKTFPPCLNDAKTWALVHDAARPNVNVSDINRLIDRCLEIEQGGILAVKVRDTIKKCEHDTNVERRVSTVDRANLWHALTPQMFLLQDLIAAIENGQHQSVLITDEASAIEAAGGHVELVEGSFTNIKITQPEDLQLSELFLTQDLL